MYCQAHCSDESVEQLLLRPFVRLQELEAVMARTDKNVVIYTALTWCRPCKAMAKPLSRMAQHYKDSYVFIKLFANSNEQTKRIFKDVLKVCLLRGCMCTWQFNRRLTSTGV